MDSMENIKSDTSAEANLVTQEKSALIPKVFLDAAGCQHSE